VVSLSVMSTRSRREGTVGATNGKPRPRRTVDPKGLPVRAS
jgi:hypothetical protein